MSDMPMKPKEWMGRYNPAGEPAFNEALKDPTNPIRRVLDLLLESAKEMIRDGRMKLVDGVPVFREDVQQMLVEREARRHARCTTADPCGGVFNPRIKARSKVNDTHSCGQAVAKTGAKRREKGRKVR